MIKFIYDRFAWIINSLRDETNRLSLSRSTFLASFIIAAIRWSSGLEITAYHFSFLLIQLAYILFKDRALTLIDKVLNTITLVKTGAPPKDEV